MVQNLDPKLALKKKLEHRAQQNHEHHWFGRAWPAQCGWQEVARPACAAGPKYIHIYIYIHVDMYIDTRCRSCLSQA